MIDGQSVLGLIPARGGSKGLPGKNITPVAGRPLIAWTIDCALASRYLDRLVTSTDDEDIRLCARRYGSEAPFERPAELATDEANVIETALHALTALDAEFDLLVLLQPTSPLRRPADIDGCLERLVTSDADACASVVQPDKSPYWCLRENSDGTLAPLFPDIAAKRRQALPNTWVPNGAVYAVRTAALRQQRCFLTSKAVGYPMPRERSIDIDDPLDLHLASCLLEQLEANTGWRSTG